MGTNIKGILLTEVNRMREIMGMNVINEGIDDIIKKLLGVSDEGATILKGNANELSQYSSKLKSLVGGTGSMSDITNYLSRQGVGTSDDAIAAWIKTQPEIMDQIARSSESIMKQASEIVFGRLKLTNIFDQDSVMAIEDLLSLSLNKNRVDTMINEIDDVLKILRSTRSRGTNPDVEDLIKKFEDKRKIAENYKSSLNSPSAGSGSGSGMGSGVGSSSSKLNDIMDSALNYEKVKEMLPGINDTDIKLIREGILAKYGNYTPYEILTKFGSIREEFMSSLKKVTNDSGEEVYVKVVDGKKFEFKNLKWLYDNKLTRSCVGSSSYKGVTTGTIKKELDFKVLNIASCIVGVYAISELINHINTKSDEKDLIICPILELAGLCQYGWTKNMCPKSCGGGGKSEGESGGLGPDDY
jgi:hypothetical protein